MPTAIQKLAQRKISGSIPALSSVDFDTTPLTSFSATKYLVECSGNSNYQALEIFAARILSDVDDQIYAKFPGGLNIGANVLRVGSDVVLRVTNGEIFAVSADIIKTKI